MSLVVLFEKKIARFFADADDNKKEKNSSTLPAPATPANSPICSAPPSSATPRTALSLAGLNSSPRENSSSCTPSCARLSTCTTSTTAPRPPGPTAEPAKKYPEICGWPSASISPPPTADAVVSTVRSRTSCASSVSPSDASFGRERMYSLSCESMIRSTSASVAAWDEEAEAVAAAAAEAAAAALEAAAAAVEAVEVACFFRFAAAAAAAAEAAEAAAAAASALARSSSFFRLLPQPFFFGGGCCCFCCFWSSSFFDDAAVAAAAAASLSIRASPLAAEEASGSGHHEVL